MAPSATDYIIYQMGQEIKFILLSQARPPQCPVLVRRQCHWLRGHLAVRHQVIVVVAAGLQPLDHSPVSPQVVPGALVLIPGVGDHVSRTVKPVPLAVRVQIPGVAHRLPGIAQEETPGPICALLPAGFPGLFRLLRYIILYVSAHAYQALTPSA